MKTAKAWTAGLAVAIGTAIIKFAEVTFGIDLDVATETMILTAVATFFTWLIPNAA